MISPAALSVLAPAVPPEAEPARLRPARVASAAPRVERPLAGREGAPLPRGSVLDRVA